MIPFKKYRKKPLDLQMLDIMIPRLAKESAALVPKLKHDAARRQKGFNGEKKLDYHLKQLDDSYDVLYDVTLRWDDSPFQIDTLVISPRAIYIISVKSLEGIISFQPHNRTLIQEVNGSSHRYECPILQAERHKAMLMKWLDARKLGSLPIYYMVGIAEMSTVIQADSDQVKRHVHYVEHIPAMIQSLDKQHDHYKSIPLQKKITHHILHTSEDFLIDYFQTYHIPESQIQLGILCKNCNSLEHIVYQRKYLCSKCGVLSTDDILQSLYDLILLFNIQTITNHDVTRLLQLNNRHHAWRLLKKSKLMKPKHTKKWHILPRKPKTPAKVE